MGLLQFLLIFQNNRLFFQETIVAATIKLFKELFESQQSLENSYS